MTGMGGIPPINTATLSGSPIATSARARSRIGSVTLAALATRREFPPLDVASRNPLAPSFDHRGDDAALPSGDFGPVEAPPWPDGELRRWAARPRIVAGGSSVGLVAASAIVRHVGDR